MAENLESIAEHSVKSFMSGLLTVVDPVGAITSDIDYVISGAGPCDKDRAIPSFYNLWHQRNFENPDNDIPLFKGYLTRAVSKVLGVGAGLAAEAGLYIYGGLVPALVLPCFFGVHSTFRTLQTYLRDFFSGEHIKDKYERAEFETGFGLGFRETTNPIMMTFHEIERDLTGRNLGKSHVYSSVVEGAGKMRRNIGAVVGYGFGSVVVVATDILTLGILPLYNTFRDVVSNFTKKE